MHQPDYTAVTGLIAHLDSEELKDILNDDSKFDAIFNDIKQVKDWEAEKEMILTRNRSLAEYNLSKEPELIEKRGIIQTTTDEGKEICSSIQGMLEELKSKSGDVSLDTALALLQTAAAENEEQSEAIAERFLSGELDVDEFLEQFATSRKLMHARKFKADKMPELIRNTTNPPAAPGYNYMNTSNPFGGYGNSNSTPYPMGPMPGMPSMPMPSMFRPNHF